MSKLTLPEVIKFLEEEEKHLRYCAAFGGASGTYYEAKADGIRIALDNLKGITDENNSGCN